MCFPVGFSLATHAPCGLHLFSFEAQLFTFFCKVPDIEAHQSLSTPHLHEHLCKITFHPWTWFALIICILAEHKPRQLLTRIELVYNLQDQNIAHHADTLKQKSSVTLCHHPSNIRSSIDTRLSANMYVAFAVVAFLRSGAAPQETGLGSRLPENIPSLLHMVVNFATP